MTDPTGWPDPQRRGVPLNPERDGWHWIEPKFGPKAMWPAYWCARDGGYWNWQSDDASDRQDYAEHMQDGSWKYRGPCLTPAEVAAALAQARREGMEEAARGDSFAALIVAARQEADKAMRKFPQPNYVISKVAEEAGEVVKAAIHCAENRETPENVAGEMKQLIAMLYRLWVEGDQVHGLASIAAAIRAKALEAGDG